MGVGTATNNLTMTSPGPEAIEPGETRTIVCDLPCGLLNSHYLLPIGRFPSRNPARAR
jgi:hypothetical protein